MFVPSCKEARIILGCFKKAECCNAADKVYKQLRENCVWERINIANVRNASTHKSRCCTAPDKQVWLCTCTTAAHDLCHTGQQLIYGQTIH
jgi:hypothetical protein